MALQLPFDAYGVTFPTAYARVEDCSIRSQGDAIAKLIVYNNGTKQHQVSYLHAHFVYDKAGANIHTQAYEAAKLLPELAGAVDV